MCWVTRDWGEGLQWRPLHKASSESPPKAGLNCDMYTSHPLSVFSCFLQLLGIGFGAERSIWTLSSIAVPLSASTPPLKVSLIKAQELICLFLPEGMKAVNEVMPSCPSGEQQRVGSPLRLGMGSQHHHLGCKQRSCWESHRNCLQFLAWLKKD